MWLEYDVGILSLSETGSIAKWTRQGDQWHWSKVADPSNPERRPEDIPTAMAYIHDRIAVAIPRLGVKLWMLNKGELCFVVNCAMVTDDSTDSVVYRSMAAAKVHLATECDCNSVRRGWGCLARWYQGRRSLVLPGPKWHTSSLCVPQEQSVRTSISTSTFQLLTYECRYHIDVNTAGTHALVSQLGGRVHLVGIRQNDNKGNIEQVYAMKDADQMQNVSYESGVTFVSKCQLLVYGCADGSSLVWNKDNAELIYGLDHGESEIP